MTARDRRGLFVGLTTVDVVLRVERHPRANEKIVAGSRLLLAGGPAANAAIAFARLGGAATLLTELGDSPLAQLARADLAAEGVSVLDRARSGQGPPLAVVLSDASDGGRSVVLSREATATESGPARGEDLAVLPSSDIVLFDGHHPQLAVPLARAARLAGVPTVLDAGSWKPVLPELCPCMDYAVASADFDPNGDGLGRLQSLGVRRVAVSAGAGPIRWRDEGGQEGRIAVPVVDVVDTPRCGRCAPRRLLLVPARGSRLRAEFGGGSTDRFGELPQLRAPSSQHLKPPSESNLRLRFAGTWLSSLLLPVGGCSRAGGVLLGTNS